MLTLNNFKQEDTYSKKEIAEDLGIVVGGTYLGNKLGKSELVAKLMKVDKKSNQQALKAKMDYPTKYNNSIREYEEGVLRNRSIKDTKKAYLDDSAWIKKEFKNDKDKNKLIQAIKKNQQQSKEHIKDLINTHKIRNKSRIKSLVSEAKILKSDLARRGTRLKGVAGRLGATALPIALLATANKIRKMRSDKGKLRGKYSK